MDEGLIKDYGEAYGRLFDHRPVLRGEINFLLREYEDRRGNREQVRLQKSLEYGREIAEKLIPSIVNQISANLTRLNLSLNATTYACQNILETEAPQHSCEWLESRRMQRNTKWAAFVEKMCDRCRAVDDECVSEVKRVEVYYSDLEEKLNLS